MNARIKLGIITEIIRALILKTQRDEKISIYYIAVGSYLYFDLFAEYSGKGSSGK